MLQQHVAIGLFKSLMIHGTTYCKRGKIHWAKLSHFSPFSGVPRKFFHKYKCLSLIVLNNEH